MTQLTIRNIGPIKDICLDIRKINVIIGPQSSGKSTIAKIISFCLWVEKDIIRHQDTTGIDADFIAEKLLKFHKLKNYITNASYISFRSDAILFVLKGTEDVSAEIAENFAKASVSKIAYIPSERNLVSIPNISTLKMDDTYIKDYVFDWLSVHSKYPKEAMIPILELNMSYYYDSASKKDVIVLGNGKEISIDEASSGIQSVIPLYVYVNYITQWIYDNKSETSFDDEAELLEGIFKGVREHLSQPLQRLLELPDMKKKMLDTIPLYLKSTSEDSQDAIYKELLDRRNRLFGYHYSQMVIEEPEQNLFPKTQYELVKRIVSMLDLNRGDRLVITTHSPYVMTSLNNLIQAGNVIAEHPAQKPRILSLFNNRQILDYRNVGAWAIKGGHITSIMDEVFHLISATELDAASEIIEQDFNKLMDYEEN